MSAPRKRQFQTSSQQQPTITSHFRPTPPDNQTQANLLSVGMRVRKSVPEGYKTHKTLPPTPTLQYTSSAPAVVQRAPASLVRSGSGGYGRELTPFCGLHKVGGWGVQHDEEEEEEEDVPGLSTSQATVFSSQGSIAVQSEVVLGNGSLRKRGYEEEVEEEMDAFFAEVDEEEEEKEEEEVRRPIARMKGGKRKEVGMGRIFGGDGVEGDFEEANFLVAPGEGMEVD